MKLYDVEQSAQKDIIDANQVQEILKPSQVESLTDKFAQLKV